MSGMLVAVSRYQPGGDPLSQPLLARAQGRVHDAFPAPGRRRLDPLCSATRQQLLPHPIGLTLLLTDLTGQPCGQLLRGTRRAYVSDRCGCTRCRAANRATDQRRTAAIAHGRMGTVRRRPTST